MACCATLLTSRQGGDFVANVAVHRIAMIKYICWCCSFCVVTGRMGRAPSIVDLTLVCANMQRAGQEWRGGGGGTLSAFLGVTQAAGESKACVTQWVTLAGISITCTLDSLLSWLPIRCAACHTTG